MSLSLKEPQNLAFAALLGMGVLAFGAIQYAPAPTAADNIVTLEDGVPGQNGPEPYLAITQKQIDAITYEGCEGVVTGVTFPFAWDYDRIGDDEERKKSFAAWKESLETWDCLKEKRIGQKVMNYISLMSLVDVLQMEYEHETPLVLFERMKKEIPKEELIKAAAYWALNPGEGVVVNKAPDLDIDDGAAEDRVRDRIEIYAKKVLGRLLGKLPMQN